jgi:hypothetical protein
MIKQVLNGKVLLTALLIAGLLLVASLAYILLARPAAPQPQADVLAGGLTVIPAPTGTPRTLPATLTSLPPTSTLPSTPAPGEFGLGAYAQVNTDALNVHSEPGVNAPTIFLAFNAEIFLITAGPEEADGHTWWYLTASYDAARSGWAAEDYLTVIPSP